MFTTNIIISIANDEGEIVMRDNVIKPLYCHTPFSPAAEPYKWILIIIFLSIRISLNIPIESYGWSSLTLLSVNGTSFI